MCRSIKPLGKLYWDPRVPSRLKLAALKCTLYDPRFTNEERSFGLLWAAKSGELEGIALALHHDQQLLPAGAELVHSGSGLCTVPNERSNAGHAVAKAAADSPTTERSAYRAGWSGSQQHNQRPARCPLLKPTILEAACVAGQAGVVKVLLSAGHVVGTSQQLQHETIEVCPYQ